MSTSSPIKKTNEYIQLDNQGTTPLSLAVVTMFSLMTALYLLIFPAINDPLINILPIVVIPGTLIFMIYRRHCLNDKVRFNLHSEEVQWISSRGKIRKTLGFSNIEKIIVNNLRREEELAAQKQGRRPNLRKGSTMWKMYLMDSDNNSHYLVTTFDKRQAKDVAMEVSSLLNIPYKKNILPDD